MSVSDVKKKTHFSDIKVGFIADDILNLSKFEFFHNATFALILAAQELGLKILLAESHSLKVLNNKVFAEFNDITLKKEFPEYLTINNRFQLSVDELDILFARKDPPVNQDYLTYLQILSLVSNNLFGEKRKSPLVINNPDGILKANEKLYALNFKNFIPPTLVSSNILEMFDFISEHSEVVVKPLFKNSGEGVIYINKQKDKNIKQILGKSLSGESKIIVQKYIPGVINGDKRIIILDGKPIGGILRIPQKGEFRANIHRGAEVKSYNLSPEDIKLCEALSYYLKRDGLYFTAIDVIDNYLIEINVTCPAGLQEVEQCTGNPVAKNIVEWALSKVIPGLKV